MEKRKLVVCASASFENEIIEWKNKLENLGFEVIKYPMKIKDNFLVNYKKEFSEHYLAISKADVLLVLNLEKKGVLGYIGAGVFAEMAFAIGLNKVLDKKIDVCYLNEIPKDVLPYNDELKLWQELGWIKLFDENKR
jgi:hypothetical protein